MPLVRDFLVAIFGACCLAQFWFFWKVERILATRHNKEWSKIYGLFAMNKLVWFAVLRDDRYLHDDELTRRTKQLRLLLLILVLSWVLLAISTCTSATH
jgi:hypothetical protein